MLSNLSRGRGGVRWGYVGDDLLRAEGATGQNVAMRFCEFVRRKYFETARVVKCLGISEGEDGADGQAESQIGLKYSLVNTRRGGRCRSECSQEMRE